MRVVRDDWADCSAAGIAWDMSHYYDSIDLADLAERAQDKDYDATGLLLALQVYCGLRFLKANQHCSEYLWLILIPKPSKCAVDGLFC